MKTCVWKIPWGWLLLLAALLLLAGWAWHAHCSGVSHREIRDCVVAESAKVQAKVDVRCDALEKKLDRIESKLDRLIEMATPRLPDGMRLAE